ncbi:MAG: arsenic resistance N-acetyltransferase ArsN2 [Chloroflexota bacterium]
MNSVILQTASRNEWSQIAQLLQESDLPLDGAEDHIGDFVLAYQDHTLIGCAALERYGDSALLRSVATHQAFRGKGFGQALVRQLIDSARHAEIHTIVLLTTTADNFFPRFGFEVIPRMEAPDGVKDSAEFQGACPDSAITMHLKLP